MNEKKINLISKVNFLEIIQFNDLNYEYPNIDKSHVSKATYFRLYIEKHLSKKIDKVLYLDPDVVCINNFEKEYDDDLDKYDLKYEFDVLFSRTRNFPLAENVPKN